MKTMRKRTLIKSKHQGIDRLGDLLHDLEDLEISHLAFFLQEENRIDQGRSNSEDDTTS
jgi:hypothetical protein